MADLYFSSFNRLTQGYLLKITKTHNIYNPPDVFLNQLHISRTSTANIVLGFWEYFSFYEFSNRWFF